MCLNKLVPSFSILTKLMKKSLKAGIFDLSQKVIDLMFRYGYKPTLPALNSLISGFSRGGRIREAISLFWMLIAKGFVLNVYTYNPILSSLCNSGQTSIALAFFCSLRKRGFLLNVYSYTSLILGFSRKGLWIDAYSVLEFMQCNGCLPTVVTYTVLIKFLCKYNFVEDALRIYGMMDGKGCSPDQITYNVLFHELCTQNRIFEAIKLVEEMSVKGFHPDHFTYCTLATCMLKVGLVRTSQELLLKVLSTDKHVDVITWNVYFHSLCYDNRALEASSLLLRKVGEGFVPTNVTRNTILKGLCLEKKLEEALKFLDHNEWGREGHDVISFNTILFTACNNGHSSMIRRILYRMKSEGIEANVVTLTCLMQYFGKMGNLLSCYDLFIFMINNGYNPTTITYNVLLNMLCKNEMVEEAFQMFLEFKGSRSFPDTTSYNILMHATIDKSLLVRCLLANMYRWDLLPDGITYTLLSSSLCRRRNIRAALRLEYVMIEHEVRPHVSFYNNIMDVMFREGRLGDVYWLLLKMEFDGIELNEASSNILDRALLKGGRKRFPKAMLVLENLIRKGKILSKFEQ
ncbi:pentatricopeptide repeat-containing protein At1g64580-like [Phalaenopsis equestris]|uniref:pentatricopeptide repeat-containing protein At1g64580-like n=1 Tax=Phalaenopsis equestris TaxID=78828 RepID=UPI0009E23046|nr:pentatricopeptide repeat-containing protein At1g64580-like [Phalaenopsis equestris]